ncbi:MAG: transglycosylase SLT domain-containing protein [Gemmatimonadota bacterium]|nr:transglycosylase SLT domain-containing protein [Gemmatimonadota bacterium]
MNAPVLLFLALPWLFASGEAEETASDAVPEVSSALRDTLESELAAGRYWHTARRLHELGVGSGDSTTAFLLVRAEAGWGNWASVRDILGGASWLDSEEGLPWRFLARAREEAGEWDASAEAYTRYLGSPAARGASDSWAVAARRARVLARAGQVAQALTALRAIPSGEMVVTSWTAGELAARSAEQGDTAATAALMALVVDLEARRAAWRVIPGMWLMVGDTARASEAYAAEMEYLQGADQAAAGVELGLVLLKRGYVGQGQGLLMGFVPEADLEVATRGAAALLRSGEFDPEFTLRLARTLDRGGDGASALMAYDRLAEVPAASGWAMPESARVSRARLMGTVRPRQAAAVEEFRRLATSADTAIGARTLEAWAALRRRQGRTGDEATLRGWLLERYPGSDEAAQLRWERGNAAESRGDRAAAVREYRALIGSAPAHFRAGEARMRMGRMHLDAGRMEEAGGVFEGYLEEFPRGARWEEASYWAARVRWERGDAAGARELLADLRAEQPVSYYAVVGSELLGDPYDLPSAPGPEPVYPGWLVEGLRRIDLLGAAGAQEGVEAEEARLVGLAERVPTVALTLADELIGRGRTIAGINLGWALRRGGYGWDRRILRVVYPFPYREMVVREAEEWGVDPFILAAVIRQESAFDAGIVSHAGAVGLMQVMPTTGSGLARVHGPGDFHEGLLTTPEVNVHLGAAFFVAMSRRYDQDLPLVLSAYNAGPTRANRWRRFPEASDPNRFTERIPFTETRGYVKNVRRNRELYQVLYASPQ